MIELLLVLALKGPGPVEPPPSDELPPIAMRDAGGADEPDSPADGTGRPGDRRDTGS